MRPLLALALLTVTATAHADDKKPQDPKYAAMDVARAKLIGALDAGEPTAFADLLDATPVQVEDIWFDTPKCRKQWKKASLTAKNAPAFVACIKGLHVWTKGMLTFVGPGAEMTPRFDYVEGRAVLRRLYGDPIVIDPAVATIPELVLEAHRTTGSDLVLDAAGKAEAKAADDSGVVVNVCVDAKGVAKIKSFMTPVSPKGAAAKQIAAQLATWKLDPFTSRDKPVAVCTLLGAK
ncbi:MAG TPA: hypothetical protein VGM90_26565 [Kofleriaceae bacterium]|jgi:hypothetical protein